MTTGMTWRSSIFVCLLMFYGCGQKKQQETAKPVDPQAAVEAAFASGDYSKALRLLDSCTSCGAPHLRAEILLAKGDIDAAERLLIQSSRGGPLRAILLAEIRIAKKDLPGAQKHLDAAVSVQDLRLRVRWLAASAGALAKLSTPAKAEPALREALQAVSAQSMPRIEVGVLLDFAGIRERDARWADAMQFARLAVRSAEQMEERFLMARARLRLAELLDSINDFETAAREAQSAVEYLNAIGAKADPAYAAAARSLTAAGNFGAAASQWENALAADPSQSSYREEAAAAALEAGRLDRAEYWNGGAPTLTGAAILAAKEDPAALPAYQRLTRRNKSAPGAWLGLAQLHLRRNDIAAAIRSCRSAMAVVEDGLKGDRSETCIHLLTETDGSEGLRVATGASASALQRAARQMEAHFLLFRTGLQRSHAWSISGNEIAHFALPGRSQLTAAMGQALAPILNRIPAGARVLITPEGPLVRFEFEKFRKDGRLWIQDVTMAILPLPNLLAAASQKATTTALVSAEPLDSDPAFPRLEGVSEETRAVRAALPQALILRGPDATASNWRRYKASPFGIHHFAAPAEGNPRKPELSSVVLSPHYEGNRLYARDFASGGLEAEIVTLSSVRSALAVFNAADAAYAYASAALKAGAENVITCTGDRTALPVLFEKFYQKLASGQPPIAALRNAELELAGPGLAPAGIGSVRLFTRAPRFR